MAQHDSERHDAAEHRAADGTPEEFGSGLFDDAARRDLALPDIDWSSLPPGAERTWFDAPSGRLAAITLGKTGPRVVLVPGVTGSKEDFILMMPLLAAAGYRVESYDLAGQFHSAEAGPENLVPPRSRYDYRLFVDDLLAVLESDRLPSHVLGYSFAAIVAQLAYAERPELFSSLSLLSCPPEPGQSFRGIKRIGWMTGFGSDAWGASLMIWGIRRNVIAAPPGRLRLVRERFAFTRRSSVDDIIGLMRHAPDLTQVIADAPIPKLVAVGEHDLWPLGAHSTFASRIDAVLAVYRAGHSPCESSPHQLSRDLVALYRRAAVDG